MRHKLTPDQRQALAELREHEGLKALLLEIENAIDRFKEDVCKVHLGSNPDARADERQVLYKKLEVQGADRLYRAIVTALMPPKPEKKQDVV